MPAPSSLFLDSRVGRDERAAVLTEFALILPLILFVTISTVEFGIALRQQNMLVETVRQGGRAASMATALGTGDAACHGTPSDSGDSGCGVANASVTDPTLYAAYLAACANLPTTSTSVSERDKWHISFVRHPENVGGFNFHFLTITAQLNASSSFFLSLFPAFTPQMSLNFPLYRGSCA